MPVIYENCPQCSREYGTYEKTDPFNPPCPYPSCRPKQATHLNYRFKNACLTGDEKPKMYYHPKHGYRTPGRNDRPMPDYYKKDGFQTVEFNSYQEHKKFTESQGLVNHKVEGIRDSVKEG